MCVLGCDRWRRGGDGAAVYRGRRLALLRIGVINCDGPACTSLGINPSDPAHPLWPPPSPGVVRLGPVMRFSIGRPGAMPSKHILARLNRKTNQKPENFIVPASTVVRPRVRRWWPACAPRRRSRPPTRGRPAHVKTENNWHAQHTFRDSSLSDFAAR